ncbi:GNAT family N-acetyltransferase [Eubacterium multiforme]|uniref:Ribosomal protein S18 acetylase RimI-like enzyme n=1 Tax=Eubacterium multiforme TaxID=83339 RepID=A0ABT9US06_9FIRM|nr:GNAT family N-acetyltransferase [Eubacterium multiforme]MDQ0149059.1 ribosomal protein S18 acetylase RimI-like enzyme [Eubacterium multiforme]
MIYYEKLSSKNFSNLIELVDEFSKINNYRCNIVDIYKKLNFIKKFFYKNKVTLILLDNKYIGYIYYETVTVDTIVINDLYIKEDFLEYVNIIEFNKFQNKILIYQVYEDDLTKKILLANDFKRGRITKLLHLNIVYFHKIYENKRISFRTFKKDVDETLRCNLQNNIFDSNDRIPLQIKDIKYEEKQDFYKKDLCIFMLLDNKEIGYGQIVYNKNMYMIVNFGVLKEYRGLGYGEYLLNYLVNIAYNLNITDLYIRVDYENYKASNLYSKIGFKFVGYYATWIKS